MTGIPYNMTACRLRLQQCSGGRVDLFSTWIQKHTLHVSSQSKSTHVFLFNARIPHLSFELLRMGPPTTPSAGMPKGMPQHGRGNGNGGYTVYGSAHQARQGVHPPPLPPMNPYYHSQGQTSPIYAISARPGRPIATRRYRPGH